MAKNIAFVFPGQGAQYSGMGKDFYNQYEKAKQIYDYASEICNIDVKKICFDSSDSRIHETKYTQIAIFTTSLAILECVYGMGVTSNVNAGLSLGEYTALAASNVIDIKDLFLLVKKRGKYMQEAFPTGGAMAAVIGLSEREVVAICNQMNGNIYIANYNCPGQTVAKAIAEIFPHQLCLAVDNIDGSLVAGGRTQPAAVAFFFVNMDDLPNHIYTLLLWVFFAFAGLL